MFLVEEYVKASTIQYRDAADIIEEFAQEMSEMKGKCLDIGCGPGIVTKELILPNLSPEANLVGKRSWKKKDRKIEISFLNMFR